MASLWSIDKFHGRPHDRPRRTSPTVYFILSFRKLSLLSMIPVTIHFWSWTTLMDELETAQIQYPISCPFVQRVVQDKNVIYSSFISSSQEMSRVEFWLVRVVSRALLCRLLFPIVSPRVVHWMDDVVSLSHCATCCTLSGWRRFVVPTSGPYIYMYILSLAPHILNNSLPANSSKTLV